jgi:tetratricopeptide (TPR) repeat protein
LRALVAKRLKESPDDGWALARRGELRMHDGDVAGAVESLRRALEIAPENQEVRSLLTRTYLAALEQDFPAHQDMAKEMESLIDTPDQRMRYLRTLAAGLQAQGQLAEAFAAYVSLSDLVAEEAKHLPSLLEETVSVEPAWSVRFARWLPARMAELYTAADSELRDEIGTAVSARLNTALQGSRQDLERFISFFGFHELSAAARLEFANHLLEANSWLEAELQLTTLLEQESPQLTPQALALLARLYTNASYSDLAVSCYEQLRDDWSDVECSDGKTGRQLYDDARRQNLLQAAWQRPRGWLRGKSEVSEPERSLSRQSYRRVFPIPFHAQSGPATEMTQMVFDAGMNGAVARDAFGRQLFHVKLTGGMTFYCQQPGMSQVSRRGHLLFLTLADQLAAVDVLRAQRNEEDTILWRHSLTQPVPDLAPDPPKSAVRDHENPFNPHDPRTFFLADGSGSALGQTGPVTRHGAYFLKLRTLTCVDLLSGQLQWSRSDVPQGSKLFGDDTFVFAVPPGESEALVFSGRDGRLIGRQSTPETQRTWTTCGRFVLAWQVASKDKRLELHDAASGKIVWSETLDEDARGCLIENREVAIFEPNGRFLIRSLEHDQPLLEQMLEPEENLVAIQMVPSDDQYLLLTTSDGSRVGAVNGGLAVYPIRGRVYAFDRASGEPQWSSPARIEDYGLPSGQPEDSPVLWFVRQYTKRDAAATRAASLRTAIVCIDRRTGRLLLEKDELPSQANFCEIFANRSEQTSTLSIPGFSFQVTFTDEPVAEEPPAEIRSATRAASTTTNSLSRITNAVMEALRSERVAEDPFDGGNAQGKPEQQEQPR